MSLFVHKTVKHIPSLPYEMIAKGILGNAYTLTLLFVGETRARKLNQKYRNASYIPNVLSFPLDAKTGEIYITPCIAKKEAPKHHMSYEKYIGFLFIHGILHLKGYDHGSTMERLEKKYCAKYIPSEHHT